MGQRAFAIPEARAEYALGKRYGEFTQWVGVARGFRDALVATQFAQRVLADARVSACPMKGLSPVQQALARSGRVVESPA